MDSLAKIPIDFRRLTIGLIVALSIPPALGWLGYRAIEETPPVWTAPEARELLEQAERDFSFSAPLLLVLESEDFFQPNRITALRSTIDELRAIPNLGPVIWLGDIPEVSLLGTQQPLLPAATASESERAAAAKKLQNHPLISDNFLSKDGRTMLVLIGTWQESIVTKVAETAKTGLAPAGIQARVTGPTALYALNKRALGEDHVRIQAMVYTLVAILAIIIFRRPLAIVVAGTGPVVGMLWAVGWMYLLGEAQNELALIILPVMIMMVGFTDGVHLVVCIRQQRASGLGNREASIEAVKHVGPACFLTSMTTAIGFGSLIISDSEVIAGFGCVCALGVIATFLALILITPLLSTSFLGQNIHVASNQDTTGRLMRKLAPIVHLSNRFARTVSIIGISLTAVLLAFSLQLIPDDRLSDRVPQKSEELAAMQHCDQHMGGVRYVRVLISWPADVGLNKVWPVIKSCEQELQTEKLIGKPVSIRTCLSVFASDTAQDQPLLASLLPEELRSRFYRPKLRTAQIIARLQDRGLAVYDPVFERLNDRLKKLERAKPGFKIDTTSDLIVEARIVRDMVTDLVQSLMLASVVIFVVLGIAFRSVRLGLISIIPNVFPLAVTGALRLWISSSLDIASACSFAVCLGIAVDDTIHYLNRFRVDRAAGASAEVANERTFLSVGSALVMTTVVMLAGLGIVTTSQLPTHANFATMGCATLGSALVADLIFLPAMLSWLSDGANAPVSELHSTCERDRH